MHLMQEQLQDQLTQTVTIQELGRGLSIQLTMLEVLQVHNTLMRNTLDLDLVQLIQQIMLDQHLDRNMLMLNILELDQDQVIQ